MIALLPVKKSTLMREMPLSLIATLLLLVLINDVWLGSGTSNVLSVGDGIVLLGGFGFFIWYVFHLIRMNSASRPAGNDPVLAEATAHDIAETSEATEGAVMPSLWQSI